MSVHSTCSPPTIPPTPPVLLGSTDSDLLYPTRTQIPVRGWQFVYSCWVKKKVGPLFPRAFPRERSKLQLWGGMVLLKPMQPYCICVLRKDRAGACFHRLKGFKLKIEMNLSLMDMSGWIRITEALVLYDVNVSALVLLTEIPVCTRAEKESELWGALKCFLWCQRNLKGLLVQNSAKV